MTRATTLRCNCGGPVVLLELPTFALPHRWQAHCDLCLDPTEDAGRLAHVIGYGATVEEALWAWQDDHDEAWADQIRWSVAPTVRWSVVPTVVEEVLAQAEEEFRRQEGATLERVREAVRGEHRWTLRYEPPRARPAYPIAGGAR